MLLTFLFLRLIYSDPSLYIPTFATFLIDSDFTEENCQEFRDKYEQLLEETKKMCSEMADQFGLSYDDCIRATETNRGTFCSTGENIPKDMKAIDADVEFLVVSVLSYDEQMVLDFNNLPRQMKVIFTGVSYSYLLESGLLDSTNTSLEHEKFGKYYAKMNKRLVKKMIQLRTQNTNEGFRQLSDALLTKKQKAIMQKTLKSNRLLREENKQLLEKGKKPKYMKYYQITGPIKSKVSFFTVAMGDIKIIDGPIDSDCSYFQFCDFHPDTYGLRSNFVMVYSDSFDSLYSLASENDLIRAKQFTVVYSEPSYIRVYFKNEVWELSFGGSLKQDVPYHWADKINLLSFCLQYDLHVGEETIKVKGLNISIGGISTSANGKLLGQRSGRSEYKDTVVIKTTSDVPGQWDNFEKPSVVVTCDPNLYELDTSESAVEVTQSKPYEYGGGGGGGGNAGLIAGVVIAVIVVIVVIVVLVYFFVIKKRKSKGSSSSSSNDVENQQPVEAGADVPAVAGGAVKPAKGIKNAKNPLNGYPPGYYPPGYSAQTQQAPPQEPPQAPPQQYAPPPQQYAPPPQYPPQYPPPQQAPPPPAPAPIMESKKKESESSSSSSSSSSSIASTTTD